MNAPPPHELPMSRNFAPVACRCRTGQITSIAWKCFHNGRTCFDRRVSRLLTTNIHSNLDSDVSLLTRG